MNRKGILARIKDAKGGALACIGLVAAPLAVGGVSSLLTADAMAQFGRLAQPPLSPPAWLFPVVWTMLYTLMGVASWLVFAAQPTSAKIASARRAALIAYAAQLALNFSWSLVFFGAEMYWVALFVLLVMWALIIAVIVLARGVNRVASALLVPYLVWTTFAAYLNLGVVVLN